jgi:RecB family exonuclease
MQRLLANWLEAEAGRVPFPPVALEQRTSIEIGGWQLGGRIDRLDQLDSGDQILIDYKTGRQAPPRWLDERLGDCQLPIYAQRSGSPIAAIVLAFLHSEGVSYRAIGRAADALPGRHSRMAAGEWQAQLIRWRQQLHALIEEFAAGDTRIPGDSTELAGTLWAALARTAQSRSPPPCAAESSPACRTG